MLTSPNVFGRILVNTLINVDFPAPFGPIIPKIYPYPSPNESPLSTYGDFFSYL